MASPSVYLCDLKPVRAHETKLSTFLVIKARKASRPSFAKLSTEKI